MEQKKLREQAREERRKRREERKNREDSSGGASTKGTTLGLAQPKKLEKTAYDKITGQKIVIKQDHDSSAGPAQPTQSTMGKKANTPLNNSSFYSAPSISSASSLSSFESPPVPPPSDRFLSSDDLAPPPEDFNFGSISRTSPIQDVPPPIQDTPTPIPPVQSISYGVPIPPSYSNREAKEETPRYVPPPAPVPTPVQIPNAPPMVLQGMSDSGEKMSVAPPSGSLAEELLKRGGNLKKAEVATKKPVDNRSNLMESIKSGINLRSAKDRQLTPAEKKEAVSSNVAEILARRIAIQGSSDSELSEEDRWN